MKEEGCLREIFLSAGGGGATIYWEGCLGFQETEKWPREKWEEKDCVKTGGESRREERAGNGSWASPSPRLQTIFKKAIL